MEAQETATFPAMTIEPSPTAFLSADRINLLCSLGSVSDSSQSANVMANMTEKAVAHASVMNPRRTMYQVGGRGFVGAIGLTSGMETHTKHN